MDNGQDLGDRKPQEMIVKRTPLGDYYIHSDHVVFFDMKLVKRFKDTKEAKAGTAADYAKRRAAEIKRLEKQIKAISKFKMEF